MDGWIVTRGAVGGELAGVCSSSLMSDGGWNTVETPLTDTLTQIQMDGEKKIKHFYI